MSSRSWTPEQIKLVRRLAGTVTPAEIAARVSEIGPARSVDAVTCWANSRRLSLRPGRTKARLPSRPRHLWEASEDAMLRRLAGTLDPSEIADALNRAFGRRFTGLAIEKRASALKVSLTRRDGLTVNRMSEIFPIHRRGIVREVEAGHLVAARRSTGRKGSTWIFRPVDVEAWIRLRPFLFDWRRVQAGRWRDLVRAESLRQPYLSTVQVAELFGVHAATVQRWIVAGKVEAVKVRHGRMTGYRVPLDALGAVERIIAPLARVSKAG